MAYQRAEAIDLGYMQAQTAYPLREEQPSFEVIEGGGLDARARQGVSSSFMTRVAIAVVAVVAVVIVGSLRVFISTATVSQLEEVGHLRTQVGELEDLNSRLEVERSIDASSQRIVAIATQAYGMVYASDVDTLQIPTADPEAEDALQTSDATLADGAAGAEAEPGTDAAAGTDADTLNDSGTPVVASAEAAGEDGR